MEGWGAILLVFALYFIIWAISHPRDEAQLEIKVETKNTEKSNVNHHFSIIEQNERLQKFKLRYKGNTESIKDYLEIFLLGAGYDIKLITEDEELIKYIEDSGEEFQDLKDIADFIYKYEDDLDELELYIDPDFLFIDQPFPYFVRLDELSIETKAFSKYKKYKSPSTEPNPDFSLTNIIDYFKNNFGDSGKILVNVVLYKVDFDYIKEFPFRHEITDNALNEVKITSERFIFTKLGFQENFDVGEWWSENRSTPKWSVIFTVDLGEDLESQLFFMNHLKD